VILVDSSVWIEFLRATGSAEHLRLRALIMEEAPLATTEIVLMELLAGARSDPEADELRRLLYGRCAFVSLRGTADYELAAALYRRCRRAGDTIRSLTDCLIAIVAIGAGAELLQRDVDFDTIARHSPLRLAPV
jgi:predicted nucleic acid-binding protein